MVTPFDSKGGIDFDRLSMLTDRLIRQGISYLVALGTTAETPTLSASEKEEVVRCVVGAGGGRVPVVAGAGGNDTRSVAESSKKMNGKGVDALLSVAPYYNKPAQEGIYRHFAAIAEASDLPLILYNVPGRTSSNIGSATTLRLANEYRGKIVAVKEASGNFEQMMEIIRERPDGFAVLSGDDSITLPLLSSGGDGLISVIGNAYPALTSEMVAAALDGSYEKSRELHYRLFPMMKAIFREGNPSGVKACMAIQGHLENVLRLPLIPVSDALFKEISELNDALCEQGI